MKSQGFHLIELLIVLSIACVLLAYALPNYSKHLIQARRLQAQTALLALASQMEAYFVEHQSYQGAT
ncbi:MAG TPA: type IV pilin protein, partial [Gammaproteobacteria bacterium]|nr:type IV pilin protein [Gammaproteobacteria bacterium]